MCLIIKADNPKQLHLNLLETAYNNNSDGFGIMFYNKGKLHTQKIAPKTFKDVEKIWSKYRNLDVPMGLHFRFNTNGDTSRTMRHPFQILSKAKGDDRDMWTMHNGPQLPTPMIDDNKSDTHQFIKWVLRPQLSANPNLLYNAEWQEMIEELIGTDKFLFLDSKTKEFTIYNESEGETKDNIGWLSNTYSIQPTAMYGKRDFTYDFNSNSMGMVGNNKWDWKNNHWWDKDDYTGGTINPKSEEQSLINLEKDYDKIDHKNSQGEVTHVTYAPKPNSTKNLASFTTYPKQDNKIITTYADKFRKHKANGYEAMYNGKNIEWQDICALDIDELEDLCEENPQGIAKYIHQLIIGGI